MQGQLVKNHIKQRPNETHLRRNTMTCFDQKFFWAKQCFCSLYFGPKWPQMTEMLKHAETKNELLVTDIEQNIILIRPLL